VLANTWLWKIPKPEAPSREIDVARSVHFERMPYVESLNCLNGGIRFSSALSCIFFNLLFYQPEQAAQYFARFHQPLGLNKSFF
jgi:hypothetical protein